MIASVYNLLFVLLLFPALDLFLFVFFLMIRRPPRSPLSSSSAASDVYKRQYQRRVRGVRDDEGSRREAGDFAMRRASIQEYVGHTLGIALPWDLPYSPAEAIPWDREDSKLRTKERDNIIALTQCTKGNVKSKYVGSSELIHAIGKKPDDNNKITQVRPRLKGVDRRFDSGSMLSHTKRLEQTRSNTESGGFALSWPVEANLFKQPHRLHRYSQPALPKSTQVDKTVTEDPPAGQQGRMSSMRLRRNMPRRPASAHPSSRATPTKAPAVNHTESSPRASATSIRPSSRQEAATPQPRLDHSLRHERAKDPRPRTKINFFTGNSSSKPRSMQPSQPVAKHILRELVLGSAEGISKEKRMADGPIYPLVYSDSVKVLSPTERCLCDGKERDFVIWAPETLHRLDIRAVKIDQKTKIGNAENGDAVLKLARNSRVLMAKVAMPKPKSTSLARAIGEIIQLGGDRAPTLENLGPSFKRVALTSSQLQRTAMLDKNGNPGAVFHMRLHVPEGCNSVVVLFERPGTSTEPRQNVHLVEWAVVVPSVQKVLREMDSVIGMIQSTGRGLDMEEDVEEEDALP
eukprot:TRINITY_DN1566_c0_g1_i1.p1 TRINITY_DN1566_c0_g1~~TRINITY_DN1566_c0_g1_i1.p1  ORF type:complete len:575 (+),score=48.68 TRINITY_DN1566_c0_g1_i1:18-1742(+)